eukprot:Gb_17668 [translate_table: standard]
MSSSKAPPRDGGDQVYDDDDDEEEAVEQLEAEVKDLADKLLQLRRTTPSIFREKLESLLVSMRPGFPQLQQPSAPIQAEGASLDKPICSAAEDELLKKQGAVTLSTTRGEVEEEDRETAGQIALLKSKIAANVAAMPALLERMKLCIEKINKLDQYKSNIDYVFTKELASDR